MTHTHPPLLAPTIILLVLHLLFLVAPLPAQGYAQCCQVVCNDTTFECVTQHTPESACDRSSLLAGSACGTHGDIADFNLIPSVSCGSVPECGGTAGEEAAVIGAGGTIIGFTNPLCPTNRVCTVPIIIGNIIRAVLGIVGSIALLMFVYGGFQWMTARGDSEKVTKARQILTWATLGLVVIFASYALVDYIIKISLE